MLVAIDFLLGVRRMEIDLYLYFYRNKSSVTCRFFGNRPIVKYIFHGNRTIVTIILTVIGLFRSSFHGNKPPVDVDFMSIDFG